MIYQITLPLLYLHVLHPTLRLSGPPILACALHAQTALLAANLDGPQRGYSISESQAVLAPRPPLTTDAPHVSLYVVPRPNVCCSGCTMPRAATALQERRALGSHRGGLGDCDEAIKDLVEREVAAARRNARLKIRVDGRGAHYWQEDGRREARK